MERNFTIYHSLAPINKFTIIKGGTRVSHYARVDENTLVGDGCKLGKDIFVDSQVLIGNNVTIHNGAHIYGATTIEAGAIIGSGAILGEKKPLQRKTYKTAIRIESIRIGSCALIGTGAVILPGVTIGRYAIIRPGAVVIQDVLSHAMISGAPGHQVGFVCKCSSRLEDQGQRFFRCPECGNVYWFALSLEKPTFASVFSPMRP